jgi:RHS repeat-associated protein
VNRSEGLGSCPAYTSTYKQTFEFDSIGNMTKKVSTSAVSPKRTIGAGLNYTYDPYDYYAGFPHRLERVGNMYYRYDGNGNVIAEREGGHATTDSRNATVYNDGDLYYTDYGFGLFQEGQTDTKVYERKYTWNERNLMSSSVDRQYAVTYRYGADGQRAAKYAVRGTTSVETMYFNQFWSSRTTATSEMLESKHIFVGTSRVVTKLHRKGDDSVDYEGKNRYYYHSDHLGSAQLVTDFKGLEYERIEYTPYGELWVEKTIAGSERLPFRFTGKEFDEETGLYYYGARYLDPKVSRWLSTDPAVGEYIPSAPVNDEARKRNGNLPGMGGIYNLVNFHLYHYAGNNPVRYIDPDGRASLDSDEKVIYANLENLDDLNEAANMLNYLQADGYTVQATNKNRYGYEFTNYADMLRFMEAIQSTAADWGTVADTLTFTSLALDIAGIVSLFIYPPGSLALFGASAKLDLMAAAASGADGDLQSAMFSVISGILGTTLTMPGFNSGAARFLRPGKTIFMGTQKAMRMLTEGALISPLCLSFDFFFDSVRKSTRK